MSLDIGDALRSGIDAVTSEDGLLVGAVFLLYSLGSLVVNESLAAELLTLVFESGVYTAEQRAAIESFGGTSPFALGVGLPVTAVLVVVVALAGELVRYWAIRTFAGPAETATGGLGDRAVMAVVLGGTIALTTLLFQSVLPVVGQLGGLATTLVGSIAGPLGGLVLVTVFVYLRQEIALNDDGYGATVRNSVARFLDDPVSIIVLLVILGLFGLLGSLPGLLVGFLGATDTVLTIVSRLLATLLGTVFQVLGVAVVTDAYLQVRASARESAA
ncbi:hypothetical protein [Haloarcula salinisoli]|uniref:Uncharacterized protein n=1 Tax=Haloarcula salinisoli TaxID=2487746 RepID=A0A8J8CC54_9EURY|nr:hypothetical protein [Halomicroarcula salinisoli]MBX0287279.1 hypothetical protein [Halomicroarcula salinisoli]MBX0305158.1 hypothetical protein [Halomicroarcula salinisoli]